MIPIIRRLENIDLSNPKTAVRQLVEHIRDLESQLEDILMKLDSVNMLPLNLDDMEFYSENGSNISGDKIKIKGPDGQTFEVGYDKSSKQWVFTMSGMTTISAATVLATKIIANTISTTTITRGGETL